MNLFSKMRQALLSLMLMFVLLTTAACGGGPATATLPRSSAYQQPGTVTPGSYSQLERGNTAQGQDFGNWVVQTAKGLVQDAYVRDNNKLGVVISPQVKPKEVKDLARSLTQGFHKNFPNQDLTVLMYAPDRKLILTAKYDPTANQIHYD